MFRTALPLLVAAALTGCVSADASIRGATESQKFAQVCRTAPILHATFVALAAEKAGPKLVAQEAKAYAVLQQVCANPPVDVETALIAAADAYAVVLERQADVAEKQGG